MNWFKRNRNCLYSIKEELEIFLENNNVVFHKEFDKSDLSTDYFFDYQGGHFWANVVINDCFMNVRYRSFHKVEAQYIDSVRYKCNEFNSTTNVFKVFYTFSQDEEMIDIHLTFCSDRVFQSEFASRLGACFLLQRRFVDELTDLINDNKEKDVEMVRSRIRHNTFLINQQEINHQAGATERYRFNDTECCTLNQFVRIALGWNEIEFKELTLSSSTGVTVLNDHDAIANTDIIRTLVNDNATGYKGNVSTLVLRYLSPFHTSERVISFTVTQAGCDDTSCYVRVTAVSVPLALSRNNTLKDPAHKTFSCSVILALDRQSTENKQQEFKYMWEDAIIRIKEGETLREEQSFLASISLPDTAYNYYWGMRHFHQGRYYEALVHLENVFERMRPTMFDDNDKKLSEMFARICFHIGFCYNELSNFKMAFFYLDLLKHSSIIQHVEEYVNTLANSADLRTFQVVNEIISNINKNIEKEDDEIPQDVLEFRDFVYRRKGYTFIEYGLLDEAEKLFKELLESPISHDYAVNELAYIQRLRRDSNDAEE